MIELQGKYNTAKVFTDNIDKETISQIINLLNQDFTENCQIRIMPDCHAGAGCVIGFTANLGNKVIPNLIGVDIGCGMLTVSLGKTNLDLSMLDEIIHKYVPSGFNTHDGRIVKFDKLLDLKCYRELKSDKFERSIGTLGGGNHFIELDRDDEDNKYLIIHSGSRNLGKQVAEYYQDLAVQLHSGKEQYFIDRAKLIEDFKAKGKRKEIAPALKLLEKQYKLTQPDYPKELCFLTGEFLDKYLFDMNICQEYASLNRETMANIILNKMGVANEYFSYFQTIHNYINLKDNTIRKGSVSAYKDEQLLIPINMRDGSLLCVGKGNPDWNYSAPHGAGRLMSRRRAKEELSLEDFQYTMKDIFSTTVTQSTLDEAPMAYKPIEDIIDNIGDTVEILKIIKPIYNFKATE